MTKPSNNIVRSLYAVRDNCVGCYLSPILCDSDARMIRDFGDVVVGGKSPISDHPADYTLCRIGTMDIETGHIEPVMPTVLAHGTDFAKSTKVSTNE